MNKYEGKQNKYNSKNRAGYPPMPTNPRFNMPNQVDMIQEKLNQIAQASKVNQVNQQSNSMSIVKNNKPIGSLVSTSAVKNAETTMDMNLNYVDSYNANSPYSNTFGSNSLIMAANLDDLDISPDTTLTSGKWGPISWDITEDTATESFMIEVYFLGVNVIDAVLSLDNPSITVSVNIFGVDLKLEVGINGKCIYAKGKIYYIFGSKAFNDNIFCF